MSRYIDADKFYASQAARCWGEPIIGTCTSDNSLLADELQKLPISDVVEVTRCKDCTEWDKDEHECSHWYGFSEDDYCSLGARKDGGVKE